MSKEKFWAAMDEAKNKSNGNTDVFIQFVKRYLDTCTEDEIYEFGGYLAAYMEVVDQCVWVDMACKVINGYVSDDTGLYFALWLISQGEDVLLKALVDPDSLAGLPSIPFGQCEFEMLMGVAFEMMGENIDIDKVDIVRQKCFNEISVDIVYRNEDKYGNYEAFEDAMEDIPNVLPKLIDRAKREGFDWEDMYSF